MMCREVNFWYWVVSLLPKKLVYFCYMHVFAYSTTGDYGDSYVTDMTAMEIINRYANDNKIYDKS